ncbi:choice-of-anchor P family protein [Amycolatopsis sp. H20-H5]|uniref:choice-of-anchor P family protein n=1 Tax=Amycolatopsis sp. H20-H5 TaxID=3046309 RepID=UPI002DB70C9D|nr:choice-of-anchor P family protein [Amycolatopsis sp. H20-H5]MEC3976189.1 choice-of-anchor P family protein [Amycolatopsis sp. H20-H5]
MRVDVLRTGGVVSLAATAMLVASVASASADTAAPGEGSAYGASAAVSLLPGILDNKGLTVDTGRLAPSTTGGPTTASIVDVPLKGLVTAKVITSSAKHNSETGTVTSTASIVDATLPVLAGLAGSTPKAKVISSKCASTGSDVSGVSEIVGLDLGRIGTLPVATSPNQEIGIPGVLQVIVNEQVRHDDGSLTVNALHIKLLGGKLTDALGSGDIVLASATCGKATGNGSPPPATTNPAPTTGPGQVKVVPAGAPQTGDGSLAITAEG